MRRAALQPRKIATQRRSRATVDALVEATARILVREGFDKASTNRIAEVAGVGIGSLYQYFPGKEALVVAVAERHQREIMQQVQARLAGILDQPVHAAMRTIVAAAIDAHRVDPALHRVLAEQIPRVGKLAGLATFDRGNYAAFRAWLEARRCELRVADPELAAFVCVNAIEALAHNAVLHAPKMLSDERAAALVEEGARMLAGYLAPRHAGGRRVSRRTRPA